MYAKPDRSHSNVSIPAASSSASLSKSQAALNMGSVSNVNGNKPATSPFLQSKSVGNLQSEIAAAVQARSLNSSSSSRSNTNISSPQNYSLSSVGKSSLQHSRSNTNVHNNPAFIRTKNEGFNADYDIKNNQISTPMISNKSEKNITGSPKFVQSSPRTASPNEKSPRDFEDATLLVGLHKKAFAKTNDYSGIEGFQEEETLVSGNNSPTKGIIAKVDNFFGGKLLINDPHALNDNLGGSTLVAGATLVVAQENTLIAGASYSTVGKPAYKSHVGKSPLANAKSFEEEWNPSVPLRVTNEFDGETLQASNRDTMYLASDDAIAIPPPLESKSSTDRKEQSAQSKGRTESPQVKLNQGLALYEHVAKSATELSLKKGERVKIRNLNAGNGWMEVESNQGVRGYVPIRFILIDDK